MQGLDYIGYTRLKNRNDQLCRLLARGLHTTIPVRKHSGATFGVDVLYMHSKKYLGRIDTVLLQF
jgi:hypothetical protein